MSFSMNIGFESHKRNRVQLDTIAAYATHGITVTAEQSLAAAQYLAGHMAGEDASAFRKGLEATHNATENESLSVLYVKLEALKAEYRRDIKSLPPYTEVVCTGKQSYKFTT